MRRWLGRNDEKAETAGMLSGFAAYHLAQLFYPELTAVVWGVCLWMLVTYTFTENRRVGLPRWLLLTALAVANVYSYDFLVRILTPLLEESLAGLVSVWVVCINLAAMPRPTGEKFYLHLFDQVRARVKALPPPTRP